jgi:membrane associated rhomboid family serine protease
LGMLEGGPGSVDAGLTASRRPACTHPLITGLLFFLAVWLIVDVDRLTPSSDGSMAERQLRAAAELAGPTGVAAALALSALLVGSLLMIRRPPTLRGRRIDGQRFLFIGLWRVAARRPFISRTSASNTRMWRASWAC